MLEKIDTFRYIQSPVLKNIDVSENTTPFPFGEKSGL